MTNAGDGWRQPLTRSSFLRRMAIVGTAVPTVPTLLAGCDFGDDSESPSGASAGGKPVYGGTLRFSELNDPGGFDTRRWGDNSWLTSFAIFNGLVRLDEEGKTIEPDLLTELPKSADGLQYTLTLRKGVKFHHGRELVADDVKFTLEYILDPDNAQEAQSLYAGLPFSGKDAFLDGKAKQISGIQVLDDHRLRIDFDRPDSAFLSVMTLPMAFILPRDEVGRLGKRFATQPSGTGPFSFEKYTPNRGLTLRKNPQYFREDLPYLDAVEIQFGVDANLMLARIQRGELDLSYDVIPPGRLQALRSNPQTKDLLVEGTYNDCWYVSMSTKHRALSNLKVREAVFHAIDKDKVVRILSGLGQVANGGVFGPDTPYWQDDFPVREYDPDRAKSLLEEAGFGSGFDVRLVVTNETPDQPIAEAVQADLGQIGIRVELDALARTPAFEEKLKGDGLTVDRWELPYPHGSYVVDGGFTADAIDAGCCNWSLVTDKSVDTLAREGHTSDDAARQAEIYKEIDRKVIGEMALWVPIIYPKVAQLKSERVQGFSIPSAPTGLSKFFDRYWLAS